MQTVAAPVRGMHCAACVGKVERALSGVPGVESATVNLATERATVTFNAARANLDALRAAVADAGYELAAPAGATSAAGVAGPDDTEREREQRETRLKFMIGVVLSLPVVLGSMTDVFPWAPAWLRDRWTLLGLATPVQFWVGWQFHRGFLHDLRYRSASMSTLV